MHHFAIDLQDLPPTRDTWIYTPVHCYAASQLSPSNYPAIQPYLLWHQSSIAKHSLTTPVLKLQTYSGNALPQKHPWRKKHASTQQKDWQPVSRANPRIRHFLEPGHVFMATDLAVEAAGNFLLQMSQPYDAHLNNHPQCALDGPGCHYRFKMV